MRDLASFGFRQVDAQMSGDLLDRLQGVGDDVLIPLDEHARL